MRLLEKTQLGGISLKNRTVMAAMIRARTDTNGLMGDMTIEYYTQRSGAGLLFTESIRISEDTTGSLLTPGIFTQQ
jgi:N-ethylmaleimide reductase